MREYGVVGRSAHGQQVFGAVGVPESRVYQAVV